MKSIAVVSDSRYKINRRNPVGTVMADNLNEVFGNFVAIHNYYIDELNDSVSIDEDLILVMAGSRANQIRQYVKNPANMIIPRRAFSKVSIKPLFNLPKGTDVLVVNDNIETTFECVNSLYHICGDMVNLIPHIKGNDYSEIHYAVTPSEPEFVPDYIQHIIDVGDRVIDITTLLLIISKLQLNERSIHTNLYNYHQKTYSSNQGIEDHYNELLARTEELDHLLDLSHDGILLTNKEGQILIYNETFRRLFEVPTNLVGKNLTECLPDLDFSEFFSNTEHEDLIQYKHKFINLQKKDVVHYNQEIKMYFSFQEVTYIKKLEQNLTRKLRLKGQVARYTFDDIISQSSEVEMLIERSKRIAESDLTVLITGESGTGKEILAQAIHNASSRSKQPFIAINAAAIPENLLESELFGYSKGSFTGALKEGKTGLFERANNGTIFLDEIGDMPLHLQTKLLRVLQEKQITPIGSDHIIDIDVRIIAATYKKPQEMVASGKFRKDLFYRLNVFPLELPPLRQRKADIPLLLDHFTDHTYTLSEECLKVMMHYEWPGNIRELINVAHYITTIDESKVIDPQHLPAYIQATCSQKAPGSFMDSPLEVFSQRELSYIAVKLDREMVVEILQAIWSLNHFNTTAGRKHLLEHMKHRGIELTEAQLRRYMKEMNQLEMIYSETGRAGSYISERGLAYLSLFDDN